MNPVASSSGAAAAAGAVNAAAVDGGPVHSNTDKMVYIGNLIQKDRWNDLQLEVVWLLGKAGIHVVPRNITILKDKNTGQISARVHFPVSIDRDVCLQNLNCYLATQDVSRLVARGNRFVVERWSAIDVTTLEECDDQFGIKHGNRNSTTTQGVKYYYKSIIPATDLYSDTIFIPCTSNGKTLEDFKKEVATIVRKHVCAFLNSNGGVALIGVTVDGMRYAKLQLLTFAHSTVTAMPYPQL